MSSVAEARWAMAVRVLALVSAVLVVVVALEAGSIRRLRSELQVLRAEREEVKAGLAATWAQQSVDEVGQAIRWLNAFYADASEGFGRAGGLCSAGKLDDQAIARFAVAAFLQTRAARHSMEESIDAMKVAVRQTDGYRSIHPNPALPGSGR